MSNQIQTRNQNQGQPQAKKPTFSAMINTDGYQKMINTALKDPARARRFVASITSAVAINPALHECTPQTILSSALLGESLNLSPSPQLGQYYLVPFKNKAKYDREGNLLKPETVDAQFQLGYKGYVQLALRSGYYKRINVLDVKVGELTSWNPLTEEIQLDLMHDEREREKAVTIGYVASFEYLNGFTKTIYWSREKMEAHAERYSKGYAAKKGYTFWEKDFDAMAFKTMLRQLISKWGVMSIDLQTAFEADAVVEDAEFVQAGEIATPEVAATTPVTDENGEVIEGEIVEDVNLNDV